MAGVYTGVTEVRDIVMYPIHLEQQYESLLTSDFDRFSARLMREIRRELFPNDEDTTLAKSDGLRADADDPFSILEALKAAMLGSIGSTDDGRIKKVFSLLDAWNKSFVNESLEKMMTRLNTPQGSAVTGRVDPVKWITTTQISGSMIDTILDRTVKVNFSMKSSLFSEHANSIFDILSNGLSNGKSFPEMVDDLQRQTGADRNRARFWARDQASKFYGSVNETRQTEAGIPGYIWRCVTDGRTRDNHYVMNGTYHEWKNPPAVGLNGEKRHPGEDWNCRCWAEPAFGKEYEDPTAMKTKFEDQNVANGFVTARDMIAEVMDITRISKGLDIVENMATRGAGTYSPSTGILSLRPGIATPISTAAHELTHFLDHKIFGNGKNIFGTSTAGYSEIKSELAKTQLTKSIGKVRGGKDILTVDMTTGEVVDNLAYKMNGKTFIMRKKGERSVEYWSDSREVFARTMEKYLALKSGNQPMMAEIRKKEKNFIETFGFSQYPSDDEVMRMTDAFDTFFKRMAR